MFGSCDDILSVLMRCELVHGVLRSMKKMLFVAEYGTPVPLARRSSNQGIQCPDRTADSTESGASGAAVFDAVGRGRPNRAP